ITLNEKVIENVNSQNKGEVDSQNNDKRKSLLVSKLVTLNLKQGKNLLGLAVKANILSPTFLDYEIKPSPFRQSMEDLTKKFPVESGILKNADDEIFKIWMQLPQMPELAPYFRTVLNKYKLGKGWMDHINAAKGKDATLQLKLYLNLNRCIPAIVQGRMVKLAAVEQALKSMAHEFKDEYHDVNAKLAQLKKYKATFPKQLNALENGDLSHLENVQSYLDWQHDTLVCNNPLINFKKMICVRRKQNSFYNGYPATHFGHDLLPRNEYEDQVISFSPKDITKPVSTIISSSKGALIGDIDLHWDGDRFLYNSQDENRAIQVFETKIDGRGTRQVNPGDIAWADAFDACYLPDGRIIYNSTLINQGIPCVMGSRYSAGQFIMNADGSKRRRLTFDQDFNFTPSVMSDGRIMYTRWEYTDTAHYFTRVLMTMNPDGTNQRALYGSNSYWPTSLMYTKQIPGKPNLIVGIVSSHHGINRFGEIIVFDTNKGHKEADGVVQRIHGRGPTVKPIVKDQLMSGVLPLYMSPWPLNENYYLASMMTHKDSNYAIYLLDTFGNATLIKSDPGYDLFEATPVQKRTKPNIIPHRVNLKEKMATVVINDIYEGDGLKGVPRGEVADLMITEPYFAHQDGGGDNIVGIESAWDVRRIIGTVPIESDGSASFKVPANTPILLLPRNKDGEALQIMRSWFTAMPGEVLGCVGCHEPPSTVANMRGKHPKALLHAPHNIKPWYGPERGFSFDHEIQPILERRCSGCHDGTKKDRPNFSSQQKEVFPYDKINMRQYGFSGSYMALHPYVRRPGAESDYHLPKPMEWGPNTSELVQMLRKGHHNVTLNKEEWDKINTWINLNVPEKGRWADVRQIANDNNTKRSNVSDKFSCVDMSYYEAELKVPKKEKFIKPAPVKKIKQKVVCENWPFDKKTAEAKKSNLEFDLYKRLDLGKGKSIILTLIPAGSYPMGSNNGFNDEAPVHIQTIDRPFYMGISEVTNEQYSTVDKNHHSGFYDQEEKNHKIQGYPADLPQQPVVRISWLQAQQFCKNVSTKHGLPVLLPSEAQWEWACRAGTDTPLWFGSKSTDYSKFENLADTSIHLHAMSGDIAPKPRNQPDHVLAFIPRDTQSNDHNFIVADVASYKPNNWGLFDMTGNVSEFTRNKYMPYPIKGIGPSKNTTDNIVFRGGSWRSRAKYSTSSIRTAYPAWQPVYNVGFRVVVEDIEAAQKLPSASAPKIKSNQVSAIKKWHHLYNTMLNRNKK
ncbi:MAG: SUMF1/EgtB/PvdO family nonheme iron enzyme, partial [Planctomycetes bacterium]|nr:SUMF1/EgtB/PvdO family nonheme iron enzyme [Planctomycetota bacterium]